MQRTAAGRGAGALDPVVARNSLSAMPDPNPQLERRRKARALADFTVDVGLGDTVHPVRLCDLSELGLRGLCAARLTLRADVTVELSLPGAVTRHRIEGRIARCTAADRPGAPFTLAVHFTEVSPVTRAAIAGFVARGKRAP